MRTRREHDRALRSLSWGQHYQGIVWCPSTRTGFWLARRRGRPFVTGNTWPQALVRRMILAGTSERGCCPECGAPWVRETSRESVPHSGRQGFHARGDAKGMSDLSDNARFNWRITTVGWSPSCDHGADTAPAVVLDPFAGSGTTCLVARNLGRHAVGIELNEDYLRIAAERLQQLSLLAEGAA